MMRDRNTSLRLPGADRVAEEVREVLAGLLRTDPARLDPEQTFRLLGVDSMLSVEFVALLNIRFGTDLRATELYDYPTPSAFARHVAAVTGGVAELGESGESGASGELAERRVPLFPEAAVAPPFSGGGDPGAVVLETLREQLAEILYCDVWDIDADATFSSLGLDSILAVELIAFLNHTYGMNEKPGVLYDRPNLTSLAAYAHVSARQDHP
ncbi:acyl carrier protein [Streptomyces sp. NPDC021093]|uniref:acyl carrier protein n=1 Tax=Streptomyces sp. NPDC021093 TaxID=3365112 RepID=UPI00378CDA8D